MGFPLVLIAIVIIPLTIVLAKRGASTMAGDPFHSLLEEITRLYHLIRHHDASYASQTSNQGVAFYQILEKHNKYLRSYPTPCVFAGKNVINHLSFAGEPLKVHPLSRLLGSEADNSIIYIDTKMDNEGLIWHVQECNPNAYLFAQAQSGEWIQSTQYYFHKTATFRIGTHTMFHLKSFDSTPKQTAANMNIINY